MASVRVYLVVLVVVAVVFAVLWFMAYTNYNSLQSQYQALQTQYNSLQSQYSSLQANYTALQGQYQALQIQYNSLRRQYSELNNTSYWALLTFLGQRNWYASVYVDYNLPRELIVAPVVSSFEQGWSSELWPGQYLRTWVVVPSNYSATISITVDTTSPVQLFIFNLTNYIQWLEGSSSAYYLYDQGTYINDTVTVPGPGLYIIVVYDSSNTTVSYSFSVSVTYAQSSG
jgi:hypothetical protein